MPLPTWGNLEKSQEDKEKIEEAIQRLINEHNNDPNAHLGEGQSLYNHKVSEIIDHVVASIIADKIRDGEVKIKKIDWDRLIIQSQFESLDGWGKSSSGVENYLGLLSLLTGSTINTKREAYADIGDANDLYPSQNPLFQISVKLSENSNQEAWIVVGDPGIPYYFGFKIVNANLYAAWVDKNSNEHTYQITGIDITEWNTYKAILTGTSKLEFFINGNLKHTVTENLSTDGFSTWIYLSIKNTAAESKELYARKFLFIEDF